MFKPTLVGILSTTCNPLCSTGLEQNVFVSPTPASEGRAMRAYKNDFFLTASHHYSTRSWYGRVSSSPSSSPNHHHYHYSHALTRTHLTYKLVFPTLVRYAFNPPPSAQLGLAKFMRRASHCLTRGSERTVSRVR